METDSNRQLGVIFDMDGVLVDSYQPHFKSWRLAANQFDKTMTAQQFAAAFGQTSRQIIRQLWGQQITDQFIDEFDRQKEQLYREIISDDIPAVPGLLKLLEDLHATGAKMAVGSSGPPENVDLVLDKLDIRKYFRAIVTVRDVTRGKPDPQVFLIAAKKLNIPANRCVVIEDAPAGIEAAHRAGMKVVALTTSHQAEHLEKADLTLPDMTSLSAAKLLAILNDT